MRLSVKMTYIVFICPKCGAARYAKEGRRTARCLKCGYQIKISPIKVKIIARTKTVNEAIEIVKLYKIKGKTSAGFSRIV